MFKDDIADLYSTSGVGCGGQTLAIRVDGELVDTQSWITETTSGSFDTEDHLTVLEFASSGEVAPGEYDFSVVSTMDDYLAKQAVSSFKVYVTNIEMDLIEGVSIKVGDPKVTKKFGYRVAPAEMD